MKVTVRAIWPMKEREREEIRTRSSNAVVLLQDIV